MRRVWRCVRGSAGWYGAVRGGAGVRGGGGAHRRLSVAPVARGAVRGRARLRRLSGGGATVRGCGGQRWYGTVVLRTVVGGIDRQ